MALDFQQQNDHISFRATSLVMLEPYSNPESFGSSSAARCYHMELKSFAIHAVSHSRLVKPEETSPFGQATAF